MAYSRSKTINVQGEPRVSCIPLSCISKQKSYQRLLESYNEEAGINLKGLLRAKDGTTLQRKFVSIKGSLKIKELISYFKKSEREAN